MVEKELVFEKAYPEAILVKSAMLSSYYRAIITISRYLDLKLRHNPFGKQDLKRVLGELQVHLTTLFVQLRAKLKKEELTKLKILETAMNGKKLDFDQLYECFLRLQDKLESMGITKIELMEIPPERAVEEW